MDEYEKQQVSVRYDLLRVSGKNSFLDFSL